MPRTYHTTPERSRLSSQELARSFALPARDTLAPRLLIGRREWVSLPDLGIPLIHAKTDSGARSSSLHAEQISLSPDQRTVRFTAFSHQGEAISCQVQVHRLGRVRSSTGVAKLRIFIETTAVLPGGHCWKVLASLADRTEMRCPMLLGRQALSGHFLIDPQAVHLFGSLASLAPSDPSVRQDHRLP